MRYKFTRLILVLIICLIGGSFFNHCEAQCDTCASDIIPFPRMWIDSVNTKNRIHKLTWWEIGRRSKYAKLNKYTTAFKKSFFIADSSFSKLLSKIDGSTDAKTLRMYFSVSDESTTPGFNLEKGQLLLLFSLADYETNFNPFYFFDSSGDFQQVDSSTAVKWIRKYEQVTLRKLRGTVRKSDGLNYDSTRKRISDTRYVSFGVDSIKEAFEKEKDYQKNKNNIAISGYTLSFSSYEKSRPKNPMRLFIQFDYMRKDSAGKDVKFYIESQSDFDCRICQWKKTKEMQVEAYAVDNGHLCPAACPNAQ